MELREYVKIFKKNISTAIYTILVFCVIAYVWSVKKSETFSASVMISISRSETQSTADYRYDQFYRVQADEKFAETVQGWLKTPGVVSEIIEKSGVEKKAESIRQLSKSFRSEKVSPETVEVRYSSMNSDEAKRFGSAIGEVISEKTKDLNAEAKDPDWFLVKSSNLIILKNSQNLTFNLAIAALVGLFFGTLLAFAKHYVTTESE